MAKIDAFFKLMSDTGASDLRLVSGNSPALRVRGDLERVKFRVLQHDERKAMLFEICPEEEAKEFEEPRPGPPPLATAPPPDTPDTPPVERASYGERSQPQALVCVTDPTERRQILDSLKEAGYAAHLAASPAEAVDRLRFRSYAAVVVREGFDGVPGSAASLLEALADAPMGARRSTHAVFVWPSVATHDSEAAFSKSVDLTIHPNDLSHFSDALRRSLAETEQIYRVFRETQETLGRS